MALRNVPVDRYAVHVFHHQEGPAIRRGSAIQEPRDVGMFQAGQDLPLLAQARDHDGVAVLDDFDRHQFREFVIGPHGLIHDPHSAGADSLDQPVAVQSGGVVPHGQAGCLEPRFVANGRFAPKRAGFGFGGGAKQILHGVTQPLVAVARLCEEPRAS